MVQELVVLGLPDRLAATRLMVRGSWQGAPVVNDESVGSSTRRRRRLATALTYAHTDRDGRFVLTGLEPGARTVGIAAPGSMAVAFRELVGDLKEIRLRVDRPGVICGRVVTEAGGPMERFTVIAMGPAHQLAGFAGTDGWVELAEVPPGTYRVIVRPQDALRSDADATAKVAAGERVDLGELTDPARQQQERATFRGRVTFADGAVPDHYCIHRWPDRATRVAAPDGAFEIELRRLDSFELSATGAVRRVVHTFAAHQKGGPPFDLGLVVLERAHTFAVTVTRDAEPQTALRVVAGTRLSLLEGNVYWVAGDDAPFRCRREAETDEHGMALLKGLPREALVLAATPDHSWVGMRSTVDAPAGQIDIALEPAAAVVVAIDPGAPHGDQLEVTFALRSHPAVTVRGTPDRPLLLRGLPSGEWEVSCRCRRPDHGAYSARRSHVSLRGGETSTIELTPPCRWEKR
jgi:hypothetical protein